MVFRDPFFEPSLKRPFASQTRRSYALVSDRLSALLLDIVILLPLLNLIFVPFYRFALTAQLSSQSRAATIFGLLGLAVLFIVFALYQILCFRFYGQTFAMKLLGLTIEKEGPAIRRADGTMQNATARLEWSEAVVRTFSLLISLLCCGWPAVSVLSDPKGRAFHDKISGMVVYSKRAPRPESHKLWAARVLHGCYLFFGFTVLLQLHAQVASRQPWFFAVDESKQVCAVDVERAQTQSSEAHPLKKAMALYAAHAVDEDCLLAQADRSLWRDGDSGLAYLAKAMALAAEGKKSDKYLSMVCDVSATGESCRFSRLVDQWGTIGAAQISEQLEPLLNNSSLYIKIWAIRHFLANDDFARVGKVVTQNFKDMPELGPFLSMARMKAFIGSGQQEMAQLAYQGIFENGDRERKVEASAWRCRAASEFGCASIEEVSCNYLTQQPLSKIFSTSDRDVWTATARAWSCSTQALTDLSNQLERVGDASFSHYFYALDLYKRGQSTKAAKILKKVIDGEWGERRPLSFEAAYLLLEIDRSPKTQAELTKKWREVENRGRSWSALGHQLARRSFEHNNFEQTIEIAEKVSSRYPATVWANAFLFLRPESSKQANFFWLESSARKYLAQVQSRGHPRSLASTAVHLTKLEVTLSKALNKHAGRNQ